MNVCVEPFKFLKRRCPVFSAAKQSVAYNYRPVLIPDVIVHAAEVLANDATSTAAPPPPPPSPTDSSSTREPEVKHDRINSFDRKHRHRHRHVFGSRTLPTFSSSLPQLSLIRLATNNNNIKNACNLSLTSICPGNNQNERTAQSKASEARRRRFQLGRNRHTPPQDVICDRVSLTPFPLTTSHPSKMDLALSVSIMSPCSGLSTDSSTQSDLALTGHQQPCLSPPSYGAGTTQLALLSYDEEGRGGTGEDGERLIDCNSRPRKRSAGGIWRCSKSQELQPKSWQENISGYKMRRKSIHSMVNCI